MKNVLILLLSCFILISCHEALLTYEDAMEKCMQSVEVKEFTYGKGKTGKSYNYFDINCLKGAQLPLFKTQTITGEKVEIDNFKGKVNVINFWFVACKPCVAEIPGLNMLAEKYKKENIQFWAIAKNDEASLRKFLTSHEFNFNHLLNGKDLNRNKFQYKSGYPATIITNRNLEIVEIFTGGTSGPKAVEEIIQKLEPVLDRLIE